MGFCASGAGSKVSKVITTGDPTVYKPTLEPNTHWTNWPDSGSM